MLLAHFPYQKKEQSGQKEAHSKTQCGVLFAILYTKFYTVLVCMKQANQS